MMRAMSEPSEGPSHPDSGDPHAGPADLDTGDEVLTDDGGPPHVDNRVPEEDDGEFVVSGGFRWRFSTDLEAWVGWAGVLVVAVATFETLAFLITGSLQGWNGITPNLPVPTPSGYYSFVLLGGVLLLALRRTAGASHERPRWLAAAVCVAAGTGGALIVAQVVGNLNAIVHAGTANGAAEPTATTVGNIITAVGGFADAVAAAFAVALAVLLYRRTRVAAEGAAEGAPAGMAKGPGEGEGAGPAEGALEIWRPVPVHRPVVSLVVGAAVATACLVAFAVGNSRVPSYVPPNLGTGPFTVTPVIVAPTAGVHITFTEPRGGASPCAVFSNGVTVCGSTIFQTGVSPAASP